MIAGVYYSHFFVAPVMRRREKKVTNDPPLYDAQFAVFVARNAIYLIVSNGGQLTSTDLLGFMHQNPQLTHLNVENLLKILRAYPNVFELEATRSGRSQTNVVLAFEFEVCDQPRKCGGYPMCRFVFANISFRINADKLRHRNVLLDMICTLSIICGFYKRSIWTTLIRLD